MKMTYEQLRDAADKLVDENIQDKAGALKYLTTNFPNMYPAIHPTNLDEICNMYEEKQGIKIPYVANAPIPQKKKTDLTEADLATAFEHLMICETHNREVAYKELCKVFPKINVHDFNELCYKFHEETGVQIPLSKAGREQQEKKNTLAWAHAATAAEVRDNLLTMGNEPNQNYFACWELFQQGKWQIGLDQLTYDDFSAHLETNKSHSLNWKRIEKGIDKLFKAPDDDIHTRGDAFNVLTENGKYAIDPKEYAMIIKKFEIHSRLLLQSPVSDHRKDLLKEIHAWDKKDVEKYLIASQGHPPDARCSIIQELCRQGKWNGKINQNLVLKILCYVPFEQQHASSKTNGIDYSS